MPSTPLILSLYFVSFLLGQMFNAVLLSTPLKAKSLDVVSSSIGFSPKTVIIVVLSVLLVHVILIALVVRSFLMAPKPARKRTLKLFLAAADGPVNRLASVVFRLARVNVPFAASPRNTRVRNRWMAVSIPLLFRAISHRAAVTSLGTPFPTALVLFVDGVSLPARGGLKAVATRFQDAASRGRVRYLQLHILRLLLALAAASRARQHDMDDICYATIEEVPDTTGSFVEVAFSNEELNTDIPITSLASLDRNAQNVARLYHFRLPLVRHPLAAAPSRTRKLKICYPCDEFKDAFDTLVVEVVPDVVSSGIEPAAKHQSRARFSHLPLRHLAAAATLRKSRVRIMDEECHASIEETIVGDGHSAEEKMNMVAAVEVFPACTTIEVEDTTDTLAVSVIEEKIDVVLVEQEPVPAYQELDWDSAPSYEEFANSAPPEPLFERRLVALEHAIYRPPSLSVLAVRTGVKPSSDTRASRLPLLARLTSRLGDVSRTA
ncbi:hypothetical protein DFH09DRAFT_1269252 [Mycena vulgaris]|nr:hypothetical protein DFH09DRAFT_1269252 [Mycena vulgaris]